MNSPYPRKSCFEQTSIYTTWVCLHTYFSFSDQKDFGDFFLDTNSFSMNHINIRCIFSLLSASEICDVRFTISLTHVKSEYGVWPQVNVITRFEKIYYCKTKWNAQTYITILICTLKKSYLLNSNSKEISRQSFMHCICFNEEAL